MDDSARDEVALTGRIRGSGQHVYRCRIEFEWGDDWLVLHSDCSCPVGVDCKHAAAMLQLGREQTLAQLDRTEAHSQAEPALFEQKLPPWLIALQARHPEVADADDLSAWERWLETLHADHAAYEQHNEQREFGVLLRAGDTGSAASPQLLACPAWLRPAKSRARHKSMVDPKTLTPDAQWGAVPTPPGGWPAEVAIALAALGPCRHTQIGALRWAWISSRHEEHALEQLLERYPVWYERGSQPIQRGPDLPLQIHWQADQHGNQHLAATLPDRALLLRGARLWYVDRQAGQFGHVQGDARLLDRIRYAPTLQPEHAAALRQRLRASGSATGLPVPSEFEPPATVRAKPVPTLHLRVETAPDWEASHRLAVARLTFDYKGAHLPPGQAAWPVVRHLHQGKLLDIHRDIATEADARKQLGALDFVTIRELYQFRFKSDQCEPGELVVRPLAHRPPLSPEACQAILEQLAAAGFHIDYADDFPHEKLVEIEDWHADIEPSGNAWFDVSLGIDVGGERIDLLPILRRVLADPTFSRRPVKGEKKNAVHRVLIDENRSVEIPLSRLRALVEPLLEWLEDDGELRLHRSQAQALRELADDSGLVWRGGDALRKQLELLTGHKRSAREPRGFKATLRPYQRDGLAWLDFLGQAGLGGILADDMGLGKTVQVLAHIVAARQRRQLREPVLVVAPTSLVGNWRDEAARFAPQLKVLVIHGPDRADRYDEIAGQHLVITTYPLLPRDKEQLLEQKFSLLVLDEAQAIKNPRSQAARVVRELHAERPAGSAPVPAPGRCGRQP